MPTGWDQSYQVDRFCLLRGDWSLMQHLYHHYHQSSVNPHQCLSLKSMCAYLCSQSVHPLCAHVSGRLYSLSKDWGGEPELHHVIVFTRPSARSSHCVLQVLERGRPYPQVILPEFGGYWIEDPEDPPPTPPPTCMEIKEGEEKEGGLRSEEQLPEDYGYQLEEISEAARVYRKHFLGKVGLLYYDQCSQCPHDEEKANRVQVTMSY